jgi:hypothetical protein
VRETELWERLGQALGPSYARAWAEQVALTELGSRTIVEALAAGVETKRVWRAAHTMLELPASER